MITAKVQTACWLAMVLILVGCGGGGSRQQHVDDDISTPQALYEVVALHGSSSTGISCQVAGAAIEVSFTPSTEARFVRISLPKGKAVGDLVWEGLHDQQDQTVSLALAAMLDGAIELGVVPLPGAAQGLVKLNANIVTAAEVAAATASMSVETTPARLKALPAGFGTIELSWTQLLPGDYNFDAVVDVADLQAIAGQYNTALDRSSPTADCQEAFWVDGSADGVINESDISLILQNYGSSIAGYNIKRNGTLLPGVTELVPTVTYEEATKQEELPAVYSVTLSGSTQDQYTVIPVDEDGQEGQAITSTPYRSDLIVQTDISGVDLLDIIDEQPGGSVVTKEGSRIISPGDIMGRPALAKPTVVTNKKTVYSGLPRGQQLFLDIRYLPALDLATGSVRAASSVIHGCSAAVDQPATLQCTAIPFTLPESGAMLEITADINVRPNPEGGYFIEMTATLSVAGQDKQETRVRLSYVDGTLVSDTDGNGDYADEAPFTDDDRDEVSNRRLEEVRSRHEFPSYAEQRFIAQAALADLDLESSTLDIKEVQPIVGDLPALPEALHLFFNEQTIFVGALDPNDWQAGDCVVVDATLWRNPEGGGQDFYWLNYVELIPRDVVSPVEVQLCASEDQELQVQITWQPLDTISSYYLYRYQVDPVLEGYDPGTSWEIESANAGNFIDPTAIPGFTYLYRLYGITSDGDEILLGEDTGQALEDEPFQDVPQVFFGMLQDSIIDRIVMTDEWFTPVEFSFDDATQWTIGHYPGASPVDFLPGEYVYVLAVPDGDGWYALMVEKYMQEDLPPGPGPDPGMR